MEEDGPAWDFWHEDDGRVGVWLAVQETCSLVLVLDLQLVHQLGGHK